MAMILSSEYSVIDPRAVREIRVGDGTQSATVRFGDDGVPQFESIARETRRSEAGEAGVRFETVTTQHGRADMFDVDGVQYIAEGAARQVIHYRNERVERVTFWSAAGEQVGVLDVEYAGARRRKVTLRLSRADVTGEAIAIVTEGAYVRDDDGRREEITLRMNGMETARLVTEYTEDGLPARRLSIRPDGRTHSDVSYAYVKNARGDWVERTASAGGQVVATVKRTIVYRD
jgi:hypothetical protein